jgi:hypothetical protein
MNKILLLLSFVSVFSMSFYGRENLEVSPNIDNEITPMIGNQVEKTLTIKFIKGAPTPGMLNGVTVTRLRNNIPSTVPYNGMPFDILIRNGDKIMFSMNGKEPVTITIDSILYLRKIGIFMFDSTSTTQSKESIEGTAMDGFGGPIPNFPVTVTGSNRYEHTDPAGIYKALRDSSTSFTITFWSIGINPNIKHGVITATTVNNGGRTVIDVAFDDNGDLIDKK